jgi:hypothetical protein
MTSITITKAEFELFEDLKLQGTTDMLLVGGIVTLTGLPEEKVIYIQANYEELRNRFYD